MFISKKDLEEVVRDECEHDRFWHSVSKDEFAEVWKKLISMEKYLGIHYKEDEIGYVKNKKK